MSIERAFLWLVALAVGSAHANSLELNPQKILQIATQTNARRVEDILPRLPEEFRKNFAIEWSSRSLQTSSPSNPRVMMFNEDGTFVASINGDKQDSGYGDIEMLRVDKNSGKSTVWSLHFTSAGPKLEGPNPAQCGSCHGGVTSIPAGDLDLPLDTEIAYYKDFLKRNCAVERLPASPPNTPRYKLLLCEEQSLRYKDPKIAADTLNMKLGRWDSKRAAIALMATPEYSRYRYAFAAALSNCQETSDDPAELEITEFVPRVKLGGNAKLKELLNNPDLRVNRTRPNDRWKAFDRAQEQALIRLSYLGEGRGINLRKKTILYAYTATLSPHFSVTAVLPELIDLDPELKAMNPPLESLLRIGGIRASSEDSDWQMAADFCRNLKAKSLAEF